MRELSLSDTQQEVFLLQAAESFTETVNTPTQGFLGPAEIRAVFWSCVTLESIVIMACAQMDRASSVIMGLVFCATSQLFETNTWPGMSSFHMILHRSKTKQDTAVSGVLI